MTKRKLLEKYLTENTDSAYRFAYTYAKNREDAEDIVSESVIKALRSADTLKNTDYIKPWFYKIIANTSMTHLKKKGKVVFINYENAEKESFREDDYSNLTFQCLIENLDVKYKPIIVLKYLDNMTIKDISQILGVNESTVKTRLYTALKILKFDMEDEKNERL